MLKVLSINYRVQLKGFVMFLGSVLLVDVENRSIDSCVDIRLVRGGGGEERENLIT
jgi:hypothetical protein